MFLCALENPQYNKEVNFSLDRKVGCEIRRFCRVFRGWSSFKKMPTGTLEMSQLWVINMFIVLSR